MKTPWKFLVDLTSRRRAAKGLESSIGHDTNPALDYQAEQTPARPSAEVITSADDDAAVPVERMASDSNGLESDREAVQALASPVVGDEVLTPSPSEAHLADESVDEPIKTNSKPRIRSPHSRRERRMGAPANIGARSGVVTHEGQGVPRSSARDAFFAEAASLDEDIKKLRSELARKLRLQNAQLKKMLKRFDVD
ncbi:hypothetical protein HJB51_10745 [Rhizobium lentis]|uniref:hypothetical protein n=1 Tax=Rhizobium lentis TaxID=1138194 RepID=UPI001C82E221|nr:hypothetical protein [Rhizobium lentis]MBX5041249.1 hypothetical protein [Rhizobium lentis]MBX5071506.1 hypothetical protein [Rhizobium lentis]MBX5108456.1 hypothetical protein [Rhizobium lentis]MBX5117864.1 hypothetical protein [Rhizobium lentis]MBX5141384.1 hypothetical protein [Rhizobium lentis]